MHEFSSSAAPSYRETPTILELRGPEHNVTEQVTQVKDICASSA